MADINVITGNLTVSGVANFATDTFIPSGYITSSFFPTVSDFNLVKADTRFWLLNNGTEVPYSTPGYPTANTTGIRVQLNFTDANRNQLDRHIRTQAFSILTGNGFNPNTYSLIREGFKQNFTGSFYIPWSAAVGPQGLRSATRLMTLAERLDHIETSGTFALLDSHKIGFGTFQAQEKVHISNGNLRVDNTGIITYISGNNANLNNILSNKIILSGIYVPTNENSNGSSGQFSFDGNYFYYCRNTNDWVRTALSKW